MAKPKDDRRVRFAQEYAKDLNATQAAIRAGYSAKTATKQGSRLLTRVDVQQAIGKLLQKVATKNEITVERTLQQIARLAYGDVRKLYDEKGNLRPIHELDEDAAAMIGGIETDEIVTGSGEERSSIGVTRKVKTRSMERALDMCMAYLGMHKTANPAEGGSLSLTINLSGGKRVR